MKIKSTTNLTQAVPKAPLTASLMGDITNVAKEPWNMAIAYLKSQINIDEFKTVLAAGALHFEPEANDLLHSKAQFKKSNRNATLMSILPSGIWNYPKRQHHQAGHNYLCLPAL